MHRRPARSAYLSVLLSLACTALFTVQAFAGGGPENVAVVINADSWLSKTVANTFMELRQVPGPNAVYLSSIPRGHEITVDDFRHQILQPVLDTLAQRGLDDQIDYLVYSSDLPFIVNISADIKGRDLPPYITPRASINGLTFLYRQVLDKDIGYVALNANRYMRRPLADLPTMLSPADTTRLAQAVQLTDANQWAAALPVLQDLARQYPTSPDLRFHLARCLAGLQRLEEALAALEQAVSLGWTDYDRVRSATTLTPLFELGGYQQLLRRLRSGDFAYQPSQGFSHTYTWGPRGARVANGNRYLLSTVLGVSCGTLRSNTLEEITASLRASATADSTHPDGTIYYTSTQDIRSALRQPAFSAAIDRLQAEGVKAIITGNPVPENREDIRGLMMGINNFNWIVSRSKIQPGAIAENLNSLSGDLCKQNGPTPMSEFIGLGAAGTCGTVDEAFGVREKYPHPFLHVHYARGASLAEAFYQSVSSPYQLLIVGDPLCRPWATVPDVAVAELEAGAMVKGTLVLRPNSPTAQRQPIRRFELYVDGDRRGTCPPGGILSLDTRNLADGHHELRLVAVGNEPLETQGRLILPIQVNNRGHTLTATVANGPAVAWDQPITIEARTPGASRIVVVHNGRRLATINGSQGSAKLAPALLGTGTVQLHTLASVGNAYIQGTPLTLHIAPPPKSAPIRQAAPQAQKPPPKKPAPEPVVLAPPPPRPVRPPPEKIPADRIKVDTTLISPAGTKHLMALIPAGSFLMGSDAGDPDEQPVHPVHLNDYFIDLFEVTNGQYLAFLQDVNTNTDRRGNPLIDLNGEQVPIRRRSGKWLLLDSVQQQRPVVGVSWFGAQAYCRWLNARLPSEAEWEKAARGRDRRTYPWGETIEPNLAAYRIGDESPEGGPADVDTYPHGASPYGVFNMAGNVWEWVADYYDRNYYGESTVRSPEGPASGTRRVVRGGSWLYEADGLRTTNRHWNSPTSTLGFTGFRCARSR